jgi:hypothetical protein
MRKERDNAAVALGCLLIFPRAADGIRTYPGAPGAAAGSQARSPPLHLDEMYKNYFT